MLENKRMRTTVRLENGLLEQAREEARRRKITLTELIEEGLRWELTRRKELAKRPKVVLPVLEPCGFIAGIDPHNNDQHVRRYG